ncbi:hypothetical protein AQUCO_02000458v1 [Aquilegia coerulea]|uniref:DUF1230 family protein n=1 Tax=Aquilegia coerulea TaxID=218851 RepID=A0A2G5DIG1_AQUCA|nr:hypothetical protein AQUCO_02000458v1 [Aquilegia coerulea]
MATTATTLSLLSPKTIFFSNPISIINQAKFTNLQHRHKTITFSSTSSFRSPEAECPVPFEQQPINEYQSLSSSFPFSWAATDDLVEYSSRLIATGASFALFIGLPVAWFGVINPELQPLKCGIGALSSGLFVVTLAVLRMYLGWAYVGNRLLSATVEYEETGWYDGQMWIKSAEVLARDRLLGSYSVNRSRLTSQHKNQEEDQLLEFTMMILLDCLSQMIFVVNLVYNKAEAVFSSCTVCIIHSNKCVCIA